MYVARTCDGEIQTQAFISGKLDIRVHRGVPVSGDTCEVKLAIDYPGKVLGLVDDNGTIPLYRDKGTWSEYQSLIVPRRLL